MSLADVKTVIYNKAKGLHSAYKDKQAMTPDERKLMSCGGSLILDLIDQTDNNEFKKLFTAEAWNALNAHYRSMLLLREADMPEPLMEKFK
jgi:hypothetical protein